MAPPNHQVARRQLSKAAAYTLAKIQPFKKWTPKPISFARSRFGVNIVPSIKGKFILLRPSPWLPAIRVVRASVPTNPQSDTLCLFMCDPPTLSPRTVDRPHEGVFVTVLSEREGRVDEPDVRERLGEVSEGCASVGLYL